MDILAKQFRQPTPLTASLLLSVTLAGPGCAAKDRVQEPTLECEGDGWGEVCSSDYHPIPIARNREVDILFVIDNTASMGEAQAKLATSVASLIAALEADDLRANYHIGFTTTDSGNPWCSPATAGHGELVASPCTTRLDDFSLDGLVDVQALACADLCELGADALEILPSATELDSDAKPRPWLERIDGQTNLPPTTDMAAAFACFAPQGVNGCGFEAPLESMYLALVRAQTPDEPGYGFMRRNATLAIVHLTDAADCSYNQEWAEIFDAEGDKAFWADPLADSPSAAVCWNAGVECTGDASTYDSCEPANKDISGELGATDGDSVLQPLDRYIGLVARIDKEKKMVDDGLEVIVALIGGVDGAGEPVYADVSETDPDFHAEFGIGPGCEAALAAGQLEPMRAVPPVRLRDFTNAFTPGNLASICADDYSPTFEDLAQRIAAQMPVSCFWGCVKDTDPTTERIEPDCTVRARTPGEEPVTLAECLRDANGYVIDPISNYYSMPAAEINVCYVLLTGDDLAEACIDRSLNLELKVARRPGFPEPAGTSVAATCLLADFPDLSCPGI